jgi:hypothetical protein
MLIINILIVTSGYFNGTENAKGNSSALKELHNFYIPQYE